MSQKRCTKTRQVVMVAAIFCSALCGACATVQPWQRGTLSHPAMNLEPRLGSDFHNHWRGIREAAVGGEGGAGGGCGCN